jgi:hypothetical protein
MRAGWWVRESAWVGHRSGLKAGWIDGESGIDASCRIASMLLQSQQHRWHGVGAWSVRRRVRGWVCWHLVVGGLTTGGVA